MSQSLNKEGWVSKLDGHSWNQKYMAINNDKICFFKKKPESIGGNPDVSIQIKLVYNLCFSMPKSHWRNQASSDGSSSSSKSSGRAFFYLKIDYFTANLSSINSFILRFEDPSEFESWTKVSLDALNYYKRTLPSHSNPNGSDIGVVCEKKTPYQSASARPPASKSPQPLAPKGSIHLLHPPQLQGLGTQTQPLTPRTKRQARISLSVQRMPSLSLVGGHKRSEDGIIQMEEFVKRAQAWGTEADSSGERLEERNEEQNIRLINSYVTSLKNMGQSHGNASEPLALKCTERSALWFGVSSQREYATIHYASKLNCVEGVRQLLNACNNSCLALPDKFHGWTPLHWACRWDAPDVAKLLLERGADPKALDNLGRPPAVVALQYGARACYGVLAGHSSAPGIVLPEDVSSPFALATITKVHGLHVLAALGTADALREAAYQKGARGILKLPDARGCTPLHYAAGAGNLPCVNALIDFGVSLSTADQAGRTPLMAAAEGGHPECMAALLALGASTQPTYGDVTLLHAAVRSGCEDAVVTAQPFCSPRAKDAAGRTPIMLACAMASVSGMEIVQALCGDSSSLAADALHHAAAAGDAVLAEQLLDMGANPNAADALGRLPIHCCSSPDVCKTLIIRARTSPTIQSIKGERLTPLHWACKLNHYGVIDFLADIGVGIEVPTSTGSTPLIVACENKAPQALIKLLARGASPLGIMPCPAYASGTTPFLAALQNGDHESALALSKALPQGSVLGTEADANGETALRKAIRGGSADCVALTLDLGADLNAVDEEGNTPLHLAAKLGNVSALKTLAGLNKSLVTAENQAGFTPLHLAALNGHRAAVVELLKLKADVSATAAKSGNVTPLACAIRGRSESVFNALAEFAPIPQQGSPSVILSEVNKALFKSKNPRDVEFGKRVVEKALALGMDPNTRLENSSTLLQVTITHLDICAFVYLFI